MAQQPSIMDPPLSSNHVAPDCCVSETRGNLIDLAEGAVDNRLFSTKKINIVLDVFNDLLWRQQVLLALETHQKFIDASTITHLNRSQMLLECPKSIWILSILSSKTALLPLGCFPHYNETLVLAC
ncbi:hypothetical protein PVK06_000384 [Gossypium arboreum]|uniref:Uncharacterized protein n=1 Tax=Gossypium arboreum TaxID=29729 RepID=A0ABR0QZ06_GOSAR|nr:hypothetical protein PVK06_000384 [Gossypium arboreum]